MLDIYNILKTLINKNHYNSKEEIINKINVYLKFKVLSEHQHKALNNLITQKYKNKQYYYNK